MKLKSEAVSHTQRIEDEIERLSKRFILDKNKILLQILEHKKSIKNIDKERKKLKISFSNLNKEQKQYYLDILKKGIDVRF